MFSETLPLQVQPWWAWMRPPLCWCHHQNLQGKHIQQVNSCRGEEGRKSQGKIGGG